GATYELAAPGRYTAHDLTAIIATVIGKRIVAEEIDADTYLKAFFGDVDPKAFPHEARVLRAISTHYSNHDFAGNANVLTWLLGRQAARYETFVRRQFDEFKSRGSMEFSTAR